jgi:hypothetical protein
VGLLSLVAVSPTAARPLNKGKFQIIYCDGVVTYLYTGVEQSCIVPNDVWAVKVIARGGNGGTVSEPCDPTLDCPNGELYALGGQGVRVVAPIVAVHPGETLYIEVGGDGGDSQPLGSAGAGGWNGGGAGQLPPSGLGSGGGGGASDVQTQSCAPLCDPSQGPGLAALASRLVVAAGGGGAGSGGLAGPECDRAYGGNGGDAWWQGNSGSDALSGECFGPIDGAGGVAGYDSMSGRGGTDIGFNHCQYGGAAGNLGAGGAGGNDTGSASGKAGGGGGGGYAGGGGGGGGCPSLVSDAVSGGGGGGGSGSSYGPAGSFAAPSWGAPPYIQIVPFDLAQSLPCCTHVLVNG